MLDSPFPQLNSKFAMKDKQTENTQTISPQKLIIILPLNLPQCQSFKANNITKQIIMGISFSRFRKIANQIFSDTNEDLDWIPAAAKYKHKREKERKREIYRDRDTKREPQRQYTVGNKNAHPKSDGRKSIICFVTNHNELAIFIKPDVFCSIMCRF